MPDTDIPAEPQRRFDLARLELARLRIEDGITLDDFFQRATEASAEALNVERAGVWLLVDQGNALRCANLFERSKAEHSAGLTLHLDEFPEYRAALAVRRTVPAEVAATDPRTSSLAEAYLNPLGITSMLDASILVAGELVGVICHEHVGPHREWSTEERDFAGSMADLVSLKIRAAEMEEARVALRTQAAQLAEARRLDSLADLAAGVAHDFNNILLVMNCGADTILQKADTPELRAAAQLIAEAGQKGVGLARELMSIARPSGKQSRVIRPVEVIAAQESLLRNAVGPRHTFVLDIRSASGRVLIAPEQLERLLLNLVVNARDAMPDGGEIRVTVNSVQARDDNEQPGRYLLIEVADKGEGIPKELFPRIFDPFFTTKPRGQGTGLGLAIVQQIVNYSGGFIRVESVVGQGTTFRVYLPWASAQG